MTNVNTANKILGTAYDAAGSLVGKKVRFNHVTEELKQLYPTLSLAKGLRVIEDDQGRILGERGVRVVAIQDKYGNKGIANAAKLDIMG